MPDPFVGNRPGLGLVGSYQVSGYPFVTGSILDSANFSGINSQTKIVFPYVAKSVTIVNTSTGSISLRIHYNDIGAGNNNNIINGHHYMTLSTISGSKNMLTMPMKCKEIYVSLDSSVGNGIFELFADLTNISTIEMPALTGSGLTL